VADLDKCLLDSGLTLRKLGIKKGEWESGEIGITELKEKIRGRKEKDLAEATRTLKNQEAWARTVPGIMQDIEGGMRPVRALVARIVRDLKDASGTVGMEQLGNGYMMRGNMLLDEAAEAFKATMTGGVRNEDLINQAVKMMHGGPPIDNPQVQRLFAAMRAVEDLMLRLHTEAGGTIRRRDNHFPNTHVSETMVRGGRSSTSKMAPEGARDTWKTFVMGRLDRQQMKTQAGRQMDDEQLDELLDYVWTTLVTEGRNKAGKNVPNFVDVEARSPFANRQSMQRILHFDSADSAMAYNREYGDQDHWGTFQNAMRGMAMDTAAMRVFGADATRNFQDMAKMVEKMDNSARFTDVMAIWDNAMGFDLNGDNWLSTLGATTRNITSAAWMGSAALASLPDVWTVGLNGVLNGMNVPRMLSHMNTFSSTASRRHMTQIAGHLEYANASMATNLRFEENMGRGVTKRWSDANYRLGGMHALQDRLRHTWMMENLSQFADNAGRPIDQVDPKFRSFLSTYGLDKKWDEIRKAELSTAGEFPMMNLSTLKDDHLIAEVLGAINTERDLAVLTPDARVRAGLNRGTKPGTTGGEVVRSGTQFGSFTATQLMHMVYRYGASERVNGVGTRSAYLASSAVGMTLLGAIAYQLREIAKGREPRDMGDPQFWAMAFAYGGSAPLLMELMLTGQSRHGTSGLEAILGPPGMIPVTLAKASFGTLGKVFTGEDWAEHLGKQAEQMSTLTPFQSLWWGRAFMQRAVRDNILGRVDPTYAARQAQKAGYIEARTGQKETWSYGDGPLGELNTPY